MSTTHKRRVRQQVAGSGKTYWLVREYVAIMLDGDPSLGPANIPVITFTEAAGRELIDRVREELQRVVNGTRSPFGELERPAVDWEMERAEQVLAELGAAPIGTIHSFARRILLQAAVQAGVPFGVEVRDAMDPVAEEALRRRVGALHRELLEAQPVAAEMLFRPASFGRRKGLHDDGRALVDHVPPALLRSPQHASLTVEEADALLVRCWEEFQQSTFLPPDHLTVGELGDLMDGLCGFFETLSHGAPASVAAACSVRRAEAERLGLVFRASVASDPGPDFVLNHGARSPFKMWLTAAMRKVAEKRGIDAADPALVRIEEHDEAARSRKRARQRAHARTAGALALSAYLSERSNAGDDWLLQDELLQRALNVVSDDPDAREALRNRYPTVLLDEAQDIDATQMQLLLTLTEGLGMTVVGDPQQSIYGFRGADHGTFAELAARVAPGHQVAPQDETRRCLPLIVSTVNALFESDESARAQHTRIRGMREGTQHCGSVTALIPQPEPIPDPEKPGKEKKPSAADHRVSQADAIADQVAQMLDSGSAGAYLVEKQTSAEPSGADGQSEGKGPRWQAPTPVDIAILVHSRAAVPSIERALASRGIAVNVRTSADIARHPVSEGLAASLLAACRTDDTRSLVVALRSPVFACTDEDLTRHWMANSRPRIRPPEPVASEGSAPTTAGSVTGPLGVEGGGAPSGGVLSQAAEGHLEASSARRTAVAPAAPSVGDALDTLWRARQALLAAGPAAALDLIMRECHVAATLAAPDPAERSEAWSQVRLLVEKVSDRQLSTVEAPHLFAQWLHEQLALAGKTNGTVLHEPDAQAVTVTTIHQAKGLQWPIVVVAAPGEEWNRGVSLALVDDDVHVRLSSDYTNAPDPDDAAPPEVHRLFYVALTRARDHLVISTVGPASSKAHMRLLGSEHVGAALKAVAGEPGAWGLSAADAESLHFVTVPVAVGHKPTGDGHIRGPRGALVGPGDVQDRLAKVRRSAAKTVRREQPSSAHASPDSTPPAAPRTVAEREAEAPGAVRAVGLGFGDPRGEAPSAAATESADPQAPGRVRWAAGASANETGEFVHKVLEHLDPATFTDLAIPLEEATGTARLRAADELGLAGVDITMVDRLLTAARGSQLLARSGRAAIVRREVPISGNRVDGEVLVVVNGVIDLLFGEDVGGGGQRRWVLVDYKTDSTGRAESDFIAAYRGQLQAYAELLAAVGIEVAEKWLIRITPDGVEDLRVD